VISLTDNKGCDESCYRGKRKANFFGDAILYQVGIGRNSSRYFSSSKFVKKSDVLPQACFQVFLSDLSTYVFTSIFRLLAFLDRKWKA
jgi:hypothetical protein